MKSTSHLTLRIVLSAALVLVLGACGGADPAEDADGGALSGSVAVDGSSTVYPITEAVAEEFRTEQPDVRVTVGISGTGGGFKRFTVGETDINDASRPIKSSEIEAASANDITYIELPIAYDGISVVVNPDNDFVDHLTVEELQRIWQPGSTVTTWQDVRPDWPADEIALYGPGTDSGTFDYFTEAIVGEGGAARPDFTASEDDNVIVQGVSGDPNALGFFGFAYYDENRELLRVVPVDGGSGGPIEPSMQSINDGSYAPLSRPIFIYVASSAAARPEVESFVDFYLENAGSLAEEVGYVALPDDAYDAVSARWAQRVTGSVYAGGAQTTGKSLAELFAPGSP